MYERKEERGEQKRKEGRKDTYSLVVADDCSFTEETHTQEKTRQKRRKDDERAILPKHTFQHLKFIIWVIEEEEEDDEVNKPIFSLSETDC